MENLHFFSLSKITSQLENYLSKIEAATKNCDIQPDQPNLQPVSKGNTKMAKTPESLELSINDATDKSLDRDCTTLSRHVLQQLQSFSPDAQDLSALMNRIGLAGKLIARRLSRAGLMEGVLGFTGEVNVQGESVKKMDVYANDVFISVFKQSGLVCRLASEEMEQPYYIPENCPIGRYTLLYDPIDGSSNTDTNLSLGSIFSIRQQQGTDSDGQATDLLTNGHKQIAAGYILYGPSTMLVYTIGNGVHSFTLDPSLGEFILTEENIKIPNHGPVYSVNEGNFWQWEESIREYIRYVHRTEGYTARYSGAMVSDIHRILVQGGVFLYPGTIQKPEGKLRLLYETAPLAFLIEQAGGRATTGLVNILDVVPKKLHQRTPLIIGSKEDVAKVESFIQNGH
ncbi:inositol phosphatase/fructose-1,6-bisphosphatase [Nostoc sp. NIES-4103]|nr:inositol phosphatase/fructose-1,6-bisphosphatase [Nostoc sp. NIES-4103]